MQRWKLRLWGCTLSLKCHMLRSEYQMLVFDACCWTPVALLHRLLLLILSSTRPLEDAAFPQRLRISCCTHFCQPSLLCKRALIFIVASSLLSSVPKHRVTRALGVVTTWCIWLQGYRRIYQDLWISLLFFMQPWCRVELHKKLLIKHCVGPSWSDSVCHNSWDVKLIFMLSKMYLCLCPSCCRPLINFPPHLHTSFLGWCRIVSREQKSMLWSDFYKKLPLFYC